MQNAVGTRVFALAMNGKHVSPLHHSHGSKSHHGALFVISSSAVTHVNILYFGCVRSLKEKRPPLTPVALEHLNELISGLWRAMGIGTCCKIDKSKNILQILTVFMVPCSFGIFLFKAAVRKKGSKDLQKAHIIYSQIVFSSIHKQSYKAGFIFSKVNSC